MRNEATPDEWCRELEELCRPDAKWIDKNRDPTMRERNFNRIRNIVQALRSTRIAILTHMKDELFFEFKMADAPEETWDERRTELWEDFLRIIVVSNDTESVFEVLNGVLADTQENAEDILGDVVEKLVEQDELMQKINIANRSIDGLIFAERWKKTRMLLQQVLQDPPLVVQLLINEPLHIRFPEDGNEGMR